MNVITGIVIGFVLVTVFLAVMTAVRKNERKGFASLFIFFLLMTGIMILVYTGNTRVITAIMSVTIGEHISAAGVAAAAMLIVIMINIVSSGIEDEPPNGFYTDNMYKTQGRSHEGGGVGKNLQWDKLKLRL